MTPAELKTARGDRTQVEMAQLMGVSAPSLRNWEQGVSPIPAYVPVIIAGLAPPAPKGWTVILIDQRAGIATRTTVTDMQRAGDYVSAHYPGARIIPDSASPTLYAVLPLATVSDMPGAPRPGVDFILPQ